MRQFLVNIWAYDYHAKFEVLAEDNRESIEKSILDKLGEKSIKWEFCPYIEQGVYILHIMRTIGRP